MADRVARLAQIAPSVSRALNAISYIAIGSNTELTVCGQLMPGDASRAGRCRACETGQSVGLGTGLTSISHCAIGAIGPIHAIGHIGHIGVIGAMGGGVVVVGAEEGT